MHDRSCTLEPARSASDDRLLAALADGDVEAGAEIYRRYSDRVRRAAVAILRDDASAVDIAHDVFLELLRQPDAWMPDRSPLGAFLVMLARRRSIDLIRRNESAGRRERESAPTIGEPMIEVSSAVERAELCRSVRRAVIGLPPAQRSAIEEAYFGGRSYRQVAEVLSIPEGTAKTRLRSALATLRQHPELRAHR